MSWWEIRTIVGIPVVAALFLRYLLRYRRMCPSKAMMRGKTVIITGANSGIGKAAAKELAKRKARVILGCRNMVSANETVKYIQAATGNSEVIAKELDLASLKSIRQFCNQILAEESKIDVLVNNAGVFHCPYTKTEDGFELQMGVNHFGHFLLTSLLLEKIKESAPSRIVIVSSSLHARGNIDFDDIHCDQNYNKSKAYADSKLANLLFARQLSKNLQDSNVDVLAMHPGMVATRLGRHIVSQLTATLLSPLVVALGLRNATEGCQAIVYCCVAEELKGQNGKYIAKDFQESTVSPKASDDAAAKKLWKLSTKLTS